MDLTLTIGGAIILIAGTVFTVFTYGEHILCSGTGAFLGFIILMIGLVNSEQKSTKSQQPVIQQPIKPPDQQPLFYCTECGKPNYKNSKYCENCGTEFISK
jgi:hypothetical protein